MKGKVNGKKIKKKIPFDVKVRISILSESSFVLPVERSLQDHWSWAPEDQSLPKNKQNQYFLYTLLTGSFLSYKCVGTYKNQLKKGWGRGKSF